MKSTTAVILLMFIVAFLHLSYSTKCYQCNSIVPGCGKTVDKKYLINCPENNQCGTLIPNINGTNVIFRICEPKGIASIKLDLCNSDRCNGDVKESTAAYNNGSSIQCYVCSSDPNKRDPQCENIVDDTYLKVCPIGEVCLKGLLLNSDNNLIQILRDCSPNDLKLVSQKHCDVDGCNGDII